MANENVITEAEHVVLKTMKTKLQQLGTPRTIPNATELEGSGVEFKRKEATSLLETTFKDGVMEIPFLSIGDSTAPRFRNLIAFEQCCPVSRSPFSSYATLLDNLIDKPKNVAILKKHGIIEMRKYLTCSIPFAKVEGKTIFTSVIVAIFLLILTVVQTFIAVYAYYQPLKQP